MPIPKMLEELQPYWPLITKFIIGVIGALAYFVSVKTQIVPLEQHDKDNAYFWKPLPIMFYCFIGGLIPILFETGNLAGCFIQGLTLRPILLGLYKGTEQNGSKGLDKV
jgi:hypothetical protein